MKKILLKTSLVFFISSCAALDGMPEPVFNSDSVVETVSSNYGFATAIGHMAEISASNYTGNENPRTYRDQVAAAYLMAIDTRYLEFRQHLSQSLKGGNIGFDLAILGLTGVGAMWGRVASDFSAAATGFAGARASVNRELYFERTLPALVSLMEAGRLEVRSRITAGLNQPVNEYTIQELFADLHSYEVAASLDTAIQRASELAASASSDARYDFSQAVELCEISDALGANMRNFAISLDVTSEDGRARLARAATVAGMNGAAASTDSEVQDGQRETVENYLDNICTQDALTDFIRRVEAQQ